MSRRRAKSRRSAAAPRDGGVRETRRDSRVSAALWLVIALAASGLALTAYLTLVKWFGTHPAWCGEGSDCDLVQASRWSTLLGLPLAAWGFLAYAALLGFAWRMRRRPSAWIRAVSIAAFGFGFSIYLTAISVLEIEATCAYCLASFALLAAIFAILLAIRPATMQGFRWGTWAVGAAGGTALLVAGMHLHYSGVFDPAAGPEKPWLRDLAVHLSDGGARFYGAYWCPRCKDQKDAFEASAHRLPYVECSPAGRGGPQAAACATRGIARYPTWIIGGRRHEGMLEPETLARLSGFRGPLADDAQ